MELLSRGAATAVGNAGNGASGGIGRPTLDGVVLAADADMEIDPDH